MLTLSFIAIRVKAASSPLPGAAHWAVGARQGFENENAGDFF
jgi:hypothetical protein